MKSLKESLFDDNIRKNTTLESLINAIWKFFGDNLFFEEGFVGGFDLNMNKMNINIKTLSDFVNYCKKIKRLKVKESYKRNLIPNEPLSYIIGDDKYWIVVEPHKDFKRVTLSDDLYEIINNM